MRANLLNPFELIPYFTIQGFKQLLGEGDTVDRRARELLSSWVQSGRLIALKRGVYMHRRFMELHRNDADFMPAVSAILVPQSYLSTESVLQRTGIFTEATYPVTAVTAKNTRTIPNRLGTFVYRHIKPALYAGFAPGDYFGIIFFRASIAKALFDYLYLRPLPRSLRTHRVNLAEDLRLNLEEFPAESRLEFQDHVEESASEKMGFILENLKKTIWRH